MRKDDVLEYDDMLIIAADDYTILVNDNRDVVTIDGHYLTIGHTPTHYALTIYRVVDEMKLYYHYTLDNTLAIINRVEATPTSEWPEELK